jgi:hypothetical protein
VADAEEEPRHLSIGFCVADSPMRNNRSPANSAHSMCVAFITTALENGARLEDVQKAAEHRDSSTTKLYDASFEIRVGWGWMRASREAQSRAGEARRSEPLTAPAGPDNRARLNAGMVRRSALAADGPRICRTNCSKRRSASANRGMSGASILMRRERF